MQISWLGTTTIKLQTKPLNREITVIIDPYTHTDGNTPRSYQASIALYTRGHKDEVTITGDAFTGDSAGELEIGGVLVTGITTDDPEHIIFRIDAEQITVVHPGFLNKELSDKQLAELGDVDILLVPVGDERGFDAEKALKFVTAVEPRMVIPIGYKGEHNKSAKSADDFIRELSLPAAAPEKKLTIKKSKLPQEDMQITILSD